MWKGTEQLSKMLMICCMMLGSLFATLQISPHCAMLKPSPLKNTPRLHYIIGPESKTSLRMLPLVGAWDWLKVVLLERNASLMYSQESEQQKTIAPMIWELCDAFTDLPQAQSVSKW